MVTPAAEPEPLAATRDSAPMVRLRGVGKQYYKTKARGGTLKETFLAALSAPPAGAGFSALSGIDLEVARGEAIGIVGANGSGKTTLLRVIAGIAQPSEGTVEVNGRVVGMIELGAGFHPDLTGEENVRLQGTIYELGDKQVEDRMEAIFDYAELHDFRSTKLRYYSSGMIARLGFAIAINCDPEILLIDEALSVGDQAFQKRCIRAINDLRRSGVAIVFVTHQMEFAERICQRLVWLRKGEIFRQGRALDVLQSYHHEMVADRFSSTEEEGLELERILDGAPGRFGSGEAKILDARTTDSTGQVRRAFAPGEPFAIEVEYECAPSVETLDCSLTVDFEDGTGVVHMRAEESGVVHRRAENFPEGRGVFRLGFPSPPLLPGGYNYSPAISRPGGRGEHYDLHFRLYHFAVLDEKDYPATVPVELKPRITSSPA